MKKLALAALAVFATGCSSIGSINGVRMNATSTSSDDTFCGRNDDNRRLCIVMGAVAIGGLGALFLANREHNHTPAPVPVSKCPAPCG